MLGLKYGGWNINRVLLKRLGVLPIYETDRAKGIKEAAKKILPIKNLKNLTTEVDVTQIEGRN